MVSIEIVDYRSLGLISSSRRDPRIRHPRRKRRLFGTSGPRCDVNRSGAVWGTLDCYGRNEEHNAEFPSAPFQQDKHPSTVQVSFFIGLTQVSES